MSSSVRGGFVVPTGEVVACVVVGLAVDVVAGADEEACALALAVSVGGAELEVAGVVNSIGAIVNACVGTGAALAEAAGAGATGGALCVAFQAKNAITQTMVAPPMPIAS